MEVFTPLLASVFYTTCGDVFGSSEVSGAVRRSEDWWTGAPWGGQLRARIRMEASKLNSVHFPVIFTDFSPIFTEFLRFSPIFFDLLSFSKEKLSVF